MDLQKDGSKESSNSKDVLEEFTNKFDSNQLASHKKEEDVEQVP